VGSLNKQGIALLDLILAIAILALISLIALPNIGRLMPGYQRKQFLSSLDTLVQAGWQQALVTHAIHKVLFDLSNKIITLERATENVNAKGELEYVPAKGNGISTRCTIPSSIEIKQFFIEGYDEIARYAGNKNAARIWFFIMPDGFCQNVVINMLDASTKDSAQGIKQIGLILNPLNGRFYAYDEFQKS
jgi:type II secretory pathway pseudopilin PulG